MPEMKGLMPDLEGKTVLDIGCGMGHLIAHMLKLHLNILQELMSHLI